MLQQFTLAIRKATIDQDTGEMRWRADTSDVDTDLYNDNMSMELYRDFLSRIAGNEAPPETVRAQYVSAFWGGGMPYLSLSHYPDLNGDAVPGVVDALFIDGKFLKARGRLFESSLGKAVWNALRSDLERRSDTDHEPVRISIAFLDYEHVHKDTGTVFVRSFDNPEGLVCQECQANAKQKKMAGRVFKKGLLIHLALTRVPVNERTLMEVDRAMTTRKDDAASIVGPDLAAEIDKKSLLVGKADVEDIVVTRADDEQPMADENQQPVEAELTPQVDTSVAVVLDAMTAAMSALTEEIRSLVLEVRAKSAPKEDEQPEDEENDDMEEEEKSQVTLSEPLIQESASFDPQAFMVALSEAMGPTNQRLDLLITALSQKQVPAAVAPERRSIAASGVQQINPVLQPTAPAQPGQPMKIGDFVRRSVNNGQ